jgi:outer membrane protein assembly factor BamD (BamD/ComL family)
MHRRKLALLTLLVHLAMGGAQAAGQERTDFPAQAKEQYEQGKELQKTGQLDQALRAFEEAIRLGMAEFPRVHLGRAGSNLELKNYDTAIAQYTRFIEQFGLERSCRY